jgi:hypothetical protein
MTSGFATVRNQFDFKPPLLLAKEGACATVTAAHLVEIAPQRIVDDDGPAISKGLDRMADITRHDRD